MRAAIALAIAALLFAAPVAAEIFVVKLTNGNEFETRYRPREAGWDSSKVVFVTDVGNPIALPKAAIVSVIGRSEDRGFGRVIDNTTFELGLAPNDAPDAEEGADVLGATDFRDQQAALPKVGRNDPCPCGSGKKFKHCHGQLA